MSGNRDRRPACQSNTNLPKTVGRDELQQFAHRLKIVLADKIAHTHMIPSNTLRALSP